MQIKKPLLVSFTTTIIYRKYNTKMPLYKFTFKVKFRLKQICINFLRKIIPSDSSALEVLIYILKLFTRNLFLVSLFSLVTKFV